MRDVTRYGLAVGFFDGVHAGHREILSRADAALTFRNHPKSVLCPASAPRLLMTCGERLKAIASRVRTGRVDAWDFTSDLAALSPADFAKRAFPPDAVVICGADWRFGAGGEGNPDLLRRLGIAVEVVEPVTVDGEMVSSTRIRGALEKGKIELAARLLGHPYEISGEVFVGKGLGARLKHPTVNVRPECAPIARGVYAVMVSGVPAIANYGVAPTMGERAWVEPVLEIHYPTAPSALPVEGERVSVELVRFMRPERVFPTLEGLRRQIDDDVRGFTEAMPC